MIARHVTYVDSSKLITSTKREELITSSVTTRIRIMSIKERERRART